MSVRYNVNSKLGIVFVFCEGIVSDVEYFQVIKSMYFDKAYRSGMHRIIDFFEALEDLSSLEGIRSVVKYQEEVAGKDMRSEQIVLLSQNKGISLFVNSINEMIANARMKYYAVSSLVEAISLLGFEDRKQEITDFYNQSKYQTEQVNRSKN